ncbi:MAG: hypothetical protein ACOYD3_10995, partial [Kiritimatiellia bacterium]
MVDGLWLVVGGSYTLSPHFVPVGSIGRRQVVDPTDLCNQRLPYLVQLSHQWRDFCALPPLRAFPSVRPFALSILTIPVVTVEPVDPHRQYR